ncbi:MAG: response regulator transcription factor [Elusimicrobiota bacterium]|jgi:DNA-binding response OmpR family regulator
MKNPLLIVEPEEAHRKLYREALPGDEFVLNFESSGEKALECSFLRPPACVLLELRLPGMNGLEACRIFKADPRTQRVPVLFVSAAATGEDAVACLRCGADDFLAKPFHAMELLWRVRGLLRRYENYAPKPEAVVCCEHMSLDSEQGLVSVDGKPLRLTPKEFALLETFLRRPGRVLKRNYLLEIVWGAGSAVRPKVVDLTLCRLRRKLGKMGSCIETLPGFGFRFHSP